MCLRIVPLIALVLSYSPITKIAVELFSLNAPDEYFFGSPKGCQDYMINLMKIGIVGCGVVGATSGFALVMNGVGRCSDVVSGSTRSTFMPFPARHLRI